MFLISPDSGGKTDAAVLVIIFFRRSTAFVLEYIIFDIDSTSNGYGAKLQTIRANIQYIGTCNLCVRLCIKFGEFYAGFFKPGK